MTPISETRTARRLINEYEWVHTLLGIVGNVAFVAGSVCFLFDEAKVVGTWLFIAGSTGMLIGSVGQAIVRRKRHG